jgi:uncharacterized phiE125 gp8 family phage protein
MAAKLITAPLSEPITLAEAKLQLRVDLIEEDALISGLIAAAREWAESYTNRQFMAATYQLVEKTNKHCIALPKNPVQSIDSITYVDEQGVTQTLAPDTYELSNSDEPALLELYQRPNSEHITITFKSGYESAEKVPASIKSAMLLVIGYLYAHREDTVKKMPTHAEWLLNSHRIFSF